MRHHARGRVHRNATDVITSDLNFPCVQAGANRKPDLSRRRAKGERAAHRSPRTVEGRENAIASALH